MSTHHPERVAQRRRDRAIDAAERLEAVEGRVSELVAALHGLVINNVLDAETVKADATGIVEKSWTVPFASVLVDNVTAQPITVVAGTRSTDVAPATGKGVFVVPAGKARCVPLTGRALTFYGTNGATFFFAVYTRLMPIAFGS